MTIGTILVLSIFSFIVVGMLSRFFFSLADKYSIEPTGKLFAGIWWLLLIIVLVPVFVLGAIFLDYGWFGLLG
jgi:hypothetical protein